MQSLFSQCFVTPRIPNISCNAKTVIVTGANSGLGLEAARHFLRLGAHTLIMAVRNIEAGEYAKNQIMSSTSSNAHQRCEVWHLDLANYSSVNEFAARVGRELERVDILVCNAGIATRYFVLAEDNESTITINVVSTFLLISLLIPSMHRTAREFNTLPHVTVVSSDLHRWASCAELKNSSSILEVLRDPQKARMIHRYNLSKLLGVLLVRQLAQVMKEKHINVVPNMVNPGFCRTRLGRENDGWAVKVSTAVMARSAEVGSRTLVLASSAGRESHGQYLSDGMIKEDGTSGGVSKFVRSRRGEQMQIVLWEELLQKLRNICACDMHADVRNNCFLCDL